MQLHLRHKLFLTILAANLLLACLLFVGIGLNFVRRFDDYLLQQSVQRLAPLQLGLAQAYQAHGERWDWLRHQHERWGELLRQHLGEAAPTARLALSEQLPPFSPHKPPPDRPPPYSGQGLLLLRDTEGNFIMGRAHAVGPDTLWLPVYNGMQKIAELGIARPQRVGTQINQLFLTGLLRQSAWIVLFCIGLAALLAVAMARRLSQPLAHLQAAMAALASGQHTALSPLPMHGHDELAQLARSFNLLAATLGQHQQARQQWVADISHELRTPVAILRGELEALQDGIRPLEQAAINSLHAEIMRLQRLIDDLHQLSLSDLGALNYRRGQLALTPLLQDVLESNQEALRAQDLQVTLQITVAATLSADADRLHQLFQNLLSNNLRYTDTHGRLLITVSSPQAGQLSIRWEDSGPGVASADLAHLFERLYRGERARDRASGGSGLGLAIVQAIVHAHQGQISASHSPLGGLALIISLPWEAV